MTKIHCFTSISFSYLSKARVLASTLKKFHPDWTLWVCISDRLPEGVEFRIEDELFDRVLWIDELLEENQEGWIFKHNVIELCTAVKGAALEFIFKNGADQVFYIDPDIALFNNLDPVVDLLKSNSIILTPHLVSPEKLPSEIWENERSALLHGVYNLGFVAVKNSTEGRKFATWWDERLKLYCYEAASEGIYTDQRWCDLIPAFFDEVFVLRDPGYNVASWNIRNRPIYCNKLGQILVDNYSLRFYHFTKISHVGELMIEKNAGRSYTVFELLKWYRGQVEKNEDTILGKLQWAFGFYTNGEEIEYKDRKLYRDRKDLQKTFTNPFDHNTLQNWLKNST
ncbi:hypothetical protein [Methylobacterium goesingense]|uniref:Glycosyl transferase n=1 Tax=Methylobacterium goesingense TaxID=243690 RepID=A0ABV2LCR2_9HYPH|nr:hypothetical protein [Methylobacterium goesingense]GJD76676.1 hypothetical protein CFIICLFH_4934 [Methylobacterium goesingense]